MTDEIVKRKASVGEKIIQALNQSGLKPLMMTIYGEFHAPVLLADINNRVIFQYPLTEIGDVAYDTILKEKILSDYIAKEYLRDFNHDKYDVWQPFYANLGRTANHPRIYGIVRYYGIKQAVLAVFLGSSPVRDGDLEIFDMFIKAIEIKLKKELLENPGWIPPNSACLMDILDSRSPAYVKESAFRTLEEAITGGFSVMVTPAGVGERQQNIAAYSCLELMRRNRNVISVFFDGYIVSLIGEVNVNAFKPYERNFYVDFANYLHKLGLYSGLSRPFAVLNQIPAYFEQARLTALLAVERAESSLLYSGDVSHRLMFRKVAENPAANLFIHPLLCKISEYDQKNSTEYFLTLKAWCMKFFDRDAAAYDICVHRNTLVYRLNRIADTFKLDLEDLRLRQELYTSFLLLEETKHLSSDMGYPRAEN